MAIIHNPEHKMTMKGLPEYSPYVEIYYLIMKSITGLSSRKATRLSFLLS